MSLQYFCDRQRRRTLVRNARDGGGDPYLNGIDYLEVAPDGVTLEVHFLHDLPGEPDGVPASPTLTTANIAIEGGVRIQGIRATSVSASGRVLTVGVDQSGDFSTYVLRVRGSSTSSAPPAGFDPQLSEVEFSFKVDCPSDFDCAPDDACPPEELPAAPPIDYLSKDYASFRRLMLDRLSVVIPDWKDRNPADLGVALVENIAYVADYLSYYQDAVGTEAYLGTARQRVSVRRHARLLDYRMHDGCNSRTWAHFDVTTANVRVPSKTQLITKVSGLAGLLNPGSEELDRVLTQGPAIFETLHEAILHDSHNEIALYTWGDQACCLPAGATEATLLDDAANRLLLRHGDVLIFEEVKGTEPNTQPDRSHRHAVRLAEVSPEANLNPDGTRAPGPLATDPLTGDGVVRVVWGVEDALPFPLCISTDTVSGVAVVRGNVVLASHGRRTEPGQETLTVPARVSDVAALAEGPVTRSEKYVHEDVVELPATGALAQDPRRALPEVTLTSNGIQWSPRADLLNSGRSTTSFVVESDEDGFGQVRFGDGVMGRRPSAGTVFDAGYRYGNGRAGNIGADALFHIVTNLPTVLGVRNPIAAQGGTDPEPIERVRTDAPQAFRIQERAVTEEDYAGAAQRHPDVQRAVATRRWTGSWHTMFITVDRKQGRTVDAAFEEELRLFLERYRLAVQDVEMEPPVFVPLEIEMTVCVLPGYFRGQVKEALLEQFSSGIRPDGSRGFWHPDRFSFGDTVYLSSVVAEAMKVPGVMWARVDRFQRWGKPDLGELLDGRITMARLEIAQLDNDPNAPENGRMTFNMVGGA